MQNKTIETKRAIPQGVALLVVWLPDKNSRSLRRNAHKKCCFCKLGKRKRRFAKNVSTQEFYLDSDEEVQKTRTSFFAFGKNRSCKLKRVISNPFALPIIQDDGKFRRFRHILRIDSGFPDDFFKLHFKFEPP